MPQPRVLEIRPVGAQADVWTIDDAWFEGTPQGIDGRAYAAAILPEHLPASLTFSELLYELQGNATPYDPLMYEMGSIEKGLDRFMSGDPGRDRYYLSELAKLCRENAFALHIANFEYFDAHFSRLNAPRTAILLDINCGYLGLAGQNHGIRLLNRHLHGQRPVAETFFVTSRRDEVEDFIRSQISHASDRKSAWPLKTIPIVDKWRPDPKYTGPRLRQELESFFEFFKQRLPGHRGLELLATSHLQMCTVKWDGHVDSNQIPRDYVLHHAAGKPNSEYLERNSKALHHVAGAFTNQDIRNEALLEILDKVSVRPGITGDTTLLPAPGMLFLMNLADLVRECNEPMPYVPTDPARLPLVGIEFGADASVALTFAELDSPLALTANLLEQKRGGASEALRNLLTGSPSSWFNNLAKPEAKLAAQNFYGRWEEEKLVPRWVMRGSQRVGLPLRLGMRIENRSLIVSWGRTSRVKAAG
jgi:hypothetical protein